MCENKKEHKRPRMFHLDAFLLLVVAFCAYSDVTTKACCINK